eukprot:s308_g13.t3
MDGIVMAQRLIFKYTNQGDLTNFLSAYFDPKSAQASKQEAKAYAEIALSLGIEPTEGNGTWWLFEGVSTCKLKSYRKRVLYHSSRLQGKQQKNVFERYERRCHHMDGLQQNTFHVASWIATLPAAQMSQRYGELSAVTLLVKYLEFLKDSSQPLCHQLTKLLTKVFVRITEDLVDVQWTNLQETLVALLPELQPQPSPTLKSSQDVAPDTSTAAGRLLIKAMQVWRNASSDDRASYVARLEEGLLDAPDPARLRQIFRRAVAALSPPRRVGGDGDGGRDAELLMTATDLQRRLRKVVLGCLDQLDLTDPRLKPSLQLLEIFIQRFQELLLEDHQVASSRHWAQLEWKCGMAAADSIAAPETSVKLVKRKRKRQRCKHGVRHESCKHCKPCPHGNPKWSCRFCHGCPHGKRKNHCVLCNGCPHGKLKHNCNECTGCPHGKLKKNCLYCDGCPHGKTKKHCAACSGCPHGKLKHNCLFCTDVLGEAQAASKAGWKTVLLKRPGNAPLPASHGFREATSLLDEKDVSTNLTSRASAGQTLTLDDFSESSLAVDLPGICWKVFSRWTSLCWNFCPDLCTGAQRSGAQEEAPTESMVSGVAELGDLKSSAYSHLVLLQKDHNVIPLQVNKMGIGRSNGPLPWVALPSCEREAPDLAFFFF